MSDPSLPGDPADPSTDSGAVTEPASAPVDPPVGEPAAATADAAPTQAPESVATSGAEPMSEEAIVTVIAERDEYLEALQRLKAEFANARRRSDEQAANQRRQAAADLVTKLIPILDSAQAALDQGVEDVRPLSDALFDVLSGQGLSRLDPVGEPFDPERHEAVLFEPGDGESTEQHVVETMRLGYVWNDRVLRPAMVKVQG